MRITRCVICFLCSRAPTLPRSHAPALPRSHAPTLPRSHVPALPRSHAPALPRSRAPTLPRSHTPALPRSHTPSKLRRTYNKLQGLRYHFLLLINRGFSYTGSQLGGIEIVGDNLLTDADKIRLEGLVDYCADRDNQWEIQTDPMGD